MIRGRAGFVEAPAQEWGQSERGRTPAAVASPGRWSEARPKLQSVSKTASQAKSAPNLAHRCSGTPRGKTSGVANARAVVVNVTVAGAAFDPSRVTDDGETVQLAPIGAPVQLQVTV